MLLMLPAHGKKNENNSDYLRPKISQVEAPGHMIDLGSLGF